MAKDWEIDYVQGVCWGEHRKWLREQTEMMLAEGWEPFAVMRDYPDPWVTVWFKRQKET